MTPRLYVNAAIGETRYVWTIGERPARLVIERWSERGVHAQRGDVYAGRVRAVVESLGGAFVDIGRGPDGFLAFRKGRRPDDVRDGAAVTVAVRAEAAGGKGPLLKRGAGEFEPGSVPCLLRDGDLLGEFSDIASSVVTGEAARLAADAAVEDALAKEIGLPGGGSICVEPTRALVAIDVDAGGRDARAGGAAQLALSTNLAAVREAARQVSLRSLGGLVAIDCIHMRSRDHREQVAQALRAAMDAFGLAGEIAPLSRFCVAEAAITRTHRPVHEALLDARGAKTPETIALEGLRALEREGAADRGARLTLRLAPLAASWLETDAIDWRAPLTERLGARFTVEAVDGFEPDQIDVRSP